MEDISKKFKKHKHNETGTQSAQMITAGLFRTNLSPSTRIEMTKGSLRIFEKGFTDPLVQILSTASPVWSQPTLSSNLIGNTVFSIDYNPLTAHTTAPYFFPLFCLTTNSRMNIELLWQRYLTYPLGSISLPLFGIKNQCRDISFIVESSYNGIEYGATAATEQDSGTSNFTGCNHFFINQGKGTNLEFLHLFDSWSYLTQAAQAGDSTVNIRHDINNYFAFSALSSGVSAYDIRYAKFFDGNIISYTSISVDKATGITTLSGIPATGTYSLTYKANKSLIRPYRIAADEETIASSCLGISSFTVAPALFISGRGASFYNSVLANSLTNPTRGLHCVLSGALTFNATTITTTAAHLFPSSGTIVIDREIITYTGVTATTFTGCTRGTSGTIAAGHLDTAKIFYYQNCRSPIRLLPYLAMPNNTRVGDLVVKEADAHLYIGQANANSVANFANVGPLKIKQGFVTLTLSETVGASTAETTINVGWKPRFIMAMVAFNGTVAHATSTVDAANNIGSYDVVNNTYCGWWKKNTNDDNNNLVDSTTVLAKKSFYTNADTNGRCWVDVTSTDIENTVLKLSREGTYTASDSRYATIYYILFG